jgi:hypothetical protein
LTPLMIASQQGHLDIARLLIQSGAAVDSRDGSGWTPLMLASFHGHLDVISLLLQSGTATESRTYWGHTPSILASHSDIAPSLYQGGVVVDPHENGGPILSSGGSPFRPNARVTQYLTTTQIRIQMNITSVLPSTLHQSMATSKWLSSSSSVAQMLTN